MATVSPSATAAFALATATTAAAAATPITATATAATTAATAATAAASAVVATSEAASNKRLTAFALAEFQGHRCVRRHGRRGHGRAVTT